MKWKQVTGSFFLFLTFLCVSLSKGSDESRIKDPQDISKIEINLLASVKNNNVVDGNFITYNSIPQISERQSKNILELVPEWLKNNSKPTQNVRKSDFNLNVKKSKSDFEDKNFEFISGEDEKSKPRFNKKKNRRHKKHRKLYFNQNDMLHKAVQKLLGFSESPIRKGRQSRLLPDPNKPEKLPRYVQDLYERFQSGELTEGLAHGTIVRSIHAQIGEVKGEPVFRFNLSSLKPTEQLLSAEVHLYKRKLKPWVDKLLIQANLVEDGTHFLNQQGNITMEKEHKGWQYYDITASAQTCFSKKSSSHILGVSFKSIKDNGRMKSLPLRKFGRHHSMPFLVIYSNETQEAYFEQLDNLAERLKFAQSSSKYKQTKELSNDSNLNLKLTKNILLEETGHELNLKSLPRVKRSILTNEIPEHPIDYSKHTDILFPRTHPDMLQTRKESRIKLDKADLSKFSHARLKNKRRKKKNRKYYRRRKNMLPNSFSAFQDSTVTKGFDSTTGKDLCSRKKLVVDFADIGWGDWIITPKSFEAHYCSGECPFPLTKRLRPSNHATIQSIVNAIGIYKQVPRPCCVPDKMSSVSLLYFDENRNVVLKNYPGMTVQSCACR